MLYIITEDSKSGYEFWKMVFGAYFDSEDYSIKSAGGNKYLRKCFDDSLSTCKESQDAILLIFDNIGNTSNFNPGNMIDHCKRNCEEKGVTFYHSDFYCFESIFLSYKEMLNMTANCKSDIKSVVEYVNSAINRGYGYWESTDEIIDIFLDACGSKAKNREHFESELLSMSTRSIGYGLFHIKKSSIDKGKCWVSGCGDIQDAMNAYVVDKDCGQKCNFENKDTDTMTKLNDLFNNSILRESQIADLVRWKETYDKNI